MQMMDERPEDSMFATVRRVFGLLSGRERVRFFLLVIARALSGLIDVLGILLIGFIVSVAAIQLTSDGGAPIELLGFTIPALSSADMLALVVLVLGVFVVKAIVAILLTRTLAFFAAGIETVNAERIARYLLSSRLDEVKSYSKAKLQFSVTGSLTFAFTGIMNGIATIISESFLLLVVTVTLVAVNPVAALFTLAYFVVVVVIIQVLIGRKLKSASAQAVAGSIATMTALSDTLDTFREISVFGKQDFFTTRISSSRAAVSRSDATLTFLASMPRYIVETALILGVVLLVGQQFLSGQLVAGMATIGIFLTGGVRMMASLLPLQSSVANIKQNVEKAKPALEIMVKERRTRPEALAQQVALQAPAEPIARPLGVSLSDVSFAYPQSETDTLKGVSLDISAGSYVAIIGPSGAGKTTLVDLMLGLVAPDSGSVEIDRLDPTYLRRLHPGVVSYVPQRPGLVSGTIADNIALGVPADEVDFERLSDAVKAAYLSDFVDSLPDGLNTSVGMQVDSLSGGQIQRIGVARALYRNPRLLILDEATSALDATSESYISSSLQELRGTVTVLVIAHRLSTVQHADRVHLVEGGRITASGDFKTIRKTVPTVAEYVNLMSFDEG